MGPFQTPTHHYSLALHMVHFLCHYKVNNILLWQKLILRDKLQEDSFSDIFLNWACSEAPSLRCLLSPPPSGPMFSARPICLIEVRGQRRVANINTRTLIAQAGRGPRHQISSPHKNYPQLLLSANKNLSTDCFVTIAAVEFGMNYETVTFIE